MMMFHCPKQLKKVSEAMPDFFRGFDIKEKINLSQRLVLAGGLVTTLIVIPVTLSTLAPVRQVASSLTSPLIPLHPLKEGKNSKEVFGFAPYWTFNKLHKVDFSTLTTLAYFSITVNGNGELDRSDIGYQTFKSRKASELFQRAHQSGTRVVLTLTQMDNYPILAILDDPEAQERTISQAVEEVEKRGIDGINVDFEYDGDPGPEYRQRLSQFVENLTVRMHQSNPDSKVTVSVYAASVKDPKIYDIGRLAEGSDGIFMMAYDFARAGSDQAMPTAPLYGHKEGRYWYDVSTAVDDFLTQMPADKLILGVPWYGYNYVVYEPGVKAETRPAYSWRGQPATQTYSLAQDNIRPDREDVLDYKEGWDELGQVGWKAYYTALGDTWRMIFLEDTRSLGIKYDYAKSKNLAGIGIWALGFEEDKGELWSVIREKFGQKIADVSLRERTITAGEHE